MTNIAQKFLSILDKNFPYRHPLHKIFNRYSVKVSYCCMPNMGNIIKSHNKAILKNKSEQTEKPCSCRVAENCPLNGKCEVKNIVYKATVTSNNKKMDYYGLCSTEFKKRFNNHIYSFKNESKRNATELSKHIWELKVNEQDYNIHWEIIKKAKPASCGAISCQLCLLEKLSIALSCKNTTLNKRSELVSKCRHQNKFYLKII